MTNSGYAMSVAKARSERVLRFFIQQRLIRTPFRVAGGAELATVAPAPRWRQRRRWREPLIGKQIPMNLIR
jgi:hypothetical protein